MAFRTGDTGTGPLRCARGAGWTVPRRHQLCHAGAV